MSYVYILTDGESHKIGFTECSVVGRVKDLQIGNPRKISVVAIFKVDQPRELEKSLHIRFSDKQTKYGTEWFNLSPSDIEDLRGECEEASTEETPAPSVCYPVNIPRPLYERYEQLAVAEHTTIAWQLLKALRERFKEDAT